MANGASAGPTVVCLAGGVGGAKLAHGLQAHIGERLTVVVNTGDDLERHGLLVMPDHDTVMYTLAGLANRELGWGLEGETFATLDALGRYGVDTWFRLGDKDLATHLFRTERLRAGASLTEVTAEITRSWDLGLALLPMTDDRVRTRITVERPGGATEEIAMQRWFVGEQSSGAIKTFMNAGNASTTTSFATIPSVKVGSGEGRSKKHAEQSAAKEALDGLDSVSSGTEHPTASSG